MPERTFSVPRVLSSDLHVHEYVDPNSIKLLDSYLPTFCPRWCRQPQNSTDTRMVSDRTRFSGG
jgi:hypothetical protein